MLGHGLADILKERLKPVAALGEFVAGHIPDHHQTDFIAALDKVLALRIARASHSVEANRFDEIRVGSLGGSGHGKALIGVILHAVNADEPDALVIEIESLRIHPDLPEAYSVFQLVPRGERDLEGV